MTQAFNLSQLANKVNTSGQLDAATGLSGITPVANGGTGLSTLTANSVVLGNGTGAVQLVAPGSLNNVLVSNGTTWQSQAFAVYRGLSVYYNNAPGTWTCPDGITNVLFYISGGGGGGRGGVSPQPAGGSGGRGTVLITNASGNYSFTIGAGGAGGLGAGVAGAPGGTSSLSGNGISITATGGVGGSTTAGTFTFTGGTRVGVSEEAIGNIAGFGGTSAANNTPAKTWSYDNLTYRAGAGGSGGAAPALPYGGGGVSGAVVIYY